MKKPAQTKNLFLVLGTVLIVLILLQLFFTNRLATEGSWFRKVQEQTERLKTENTKLKEEITKRGSLFNIEQQAKGVGMVKISEIQFMVAEQVAQAR